MIIVQGEAKVSEPAFLPFGEPSLRSDPYPDDPIKVPVAKAGGLDGSLAGGGWCCL